MAVTSVNIGTRKIWLCSYNPADALSLLYCRMAVEMCNELLDGMSREDAHAWLRKRLPNSEKLLEQVENGWELPRDVPIGEYPITPGHQTYEMQIIGTLMRERQLQENRRAKRNRS